MKKIIFIFAAGILSCSTGFAQEDTLAVKEAPKAKFTRATFNSTRIINMQSVESVSQGNLQFLISHHFSYLWNKDATGGENFAQMLGLNSGVAHTYLSFDYSPKKWLNIGLAGVGNSRFEGFAKLKLLRQQTGPRNIPVSVAFYTMVNVNAAKNPDIDLTWNKYSFMSQLLIARKFSDRLSLQLMPTWIHFNIVPYGINNSNEVLSLGLAGKYKLTSKHNITFEYARQMNMYEHLITKNGAIISYRPDLLSVGWEINTGGHLFQFYVSSTTDASNIDQLSRNTSNIKDGNFAFGFTINRSLSLKK